MYVWIGRDGKKYQFWWNEQKHPSTYTGTTKKVTLDDINNAVIDKIFFDGNVSWLQIDEDGNLSFGPMDLYDIVLSLEEYATPQAKDAQDEPLTRQQLDDLLKIPPIASLFSKQRKALETRDFEIETNADVDEYMRSIESGIAVSADFFARMIDRNRGAALAYFQLMNKNYGNGWKTPEIEEIVQTTTKMNDEARNAYAGISYKMRRIG